MGAIRRLHFGCGGVTPDGWINVDRKRAPGIDISCDILEGLPIDDACIDSISSQHALQDLRIFEQVPALRELRRVLKPGGLLRLGLPDLDRAIDAYRAGRRDYFLPREWGTLAGDFITHVLWYNETFTPFTVEFAEELLDRSGFADVRRVGYRSTTGTDPEIVALDGRPEESFFVEAIR